MEKHNIKPFYNKDSKILILGSFPSIKSREEGFYYAHPQNRFWKVLSLVFNEPILNNVLDKKKFLLKNNIALFDVCASCNITGSSDASIKDVIPNDLNVILNNTKIEKIFLNGKTAYNLYNKFFKDKINIDVIVLPSTSSANQRFSLNDLVSVYKVLSDE